MAAQKYTVSEMRAAVADQQASTDPTDGHLTADMLAKMLDQLGLRRLDMLAEHARHLSLGDRMSCDEDDERSFVVVKIGVPYDKDGSRLAPVFFVALDAFEEEAFSR